MKIIDFIPLKPYANNCVVSLDQNIIITFVFTIVSILRGYFIRRFFNKL